MTEDQKMAWLTLHTIPNLSGVKTQRIIEKIMPEELLSYSYKELLEVGFKPAQANHLINKGGKKVEASLKWLEKSDHHLLTLNSANYPDQLKHIVTAPPVLFAQGTLSVLMKPQIAMVGSRSATREGLNIAAEFAQQFSHSGIVVTSGLALGIDGRSHQVCLDSGGESVAVLGCGFDYCYPKPHRALMKRVREHGLLVSEFLPDTPPKAANFPRRNRIISGLSMGVLVVEAGLKSGTLITARYALEQGREVFAVPGSIYNSATKGCHYLIREGATLVTCAEDVLEEISGENFKSQLKAVELSEQKQLFKSDEQLNTHQSTLLELLGEQPTFVDFLSESTHLPVNQVMMSLLELELKGLVASAGGGFIRLRMS